MFWEDLIRHVLCMACLWSRVMYLEDLKIDMDQYGMLVESGCVLAKLDRHGVSTDGMACGVGLCFGKTR